MLGELFNVSQEVGRQVEMAIRKGNSDYLNPAIQPGFSFLRIMRKVSVFWMAFGNV
jgi:hypothetical protein